MHEIVHRRAAILAVDDTPANLLALSAIIKSTGHEFVGVASGLEALEVVQTRSFAVILLDVMMPVLDGLGTLERLREIPSAKNVPVIFLTAHDLDSRVMQRAYSLGALDYLVKPVEPEILRGKLSAFIALYLQGEEIRSQAEQLRRKDRYIAVLAHDLRNPIATISLSAKQLEQNADASVRKTAERIARATSRMVRLTDDLLESAREAAAAGKPQRVLMDLTELLHELVQDFETTHPTVRFATSLQPRVRGTWDPARLTQALSNLLVNAVKYGSGWVSVVLSTSADTASVTVENGGAGIDRDQLERVFEPFVQANQGGAGVGLGLFIVREIVRGHGGDVHAFSDGGRTRFIAHLPVAFDGAADPDKVG
jgi:two-component system, sensor histidine kinase and response regulator